MANNINSDAMITCPGYMPRLQAHHMLLLDLFKITSQYENAIMDNLPTAADTVPVVGLSKGDLCTEVLIVLIKALLPSSLISFSFFVFTGT